MAAKILVTGSTGTVGSLLIKELSKKTPVRAAVHTLSKAEGIKGPNVEIAVLDLKRKDTLDAALKGIERLYLLTPFTPDQAELAKTFIDAAKRSGVRYIVKQSAMGADSEPGITLGRLHRQVERYIEDSGIPYAFLRPNSFMQNFINFFGSSIRSEGKIYLPLGQGKVSYIDARDIAATAAEVLTKEGFQGRAIELTGPEALSVADVAGAFSEALGRQVIYVDVTPEAARGGMKAAGMNEWSINALMELHDINKKGYASKVTEQVEEITGRRPLSFRQFALDNARLLKKAA
ncbi:MAG: SDR family oxidoreductase [Deltaproteobacteria bacterium]|nr:SDR family oxidoreductase [Deltaproteobacteria bacterium]